jgi:hypothetical protein
MPPSPLRLNMFRLFEFFSLDLIRFND